MKKELVKIPGHIKFLSEFESDLPHNCILDKGKTGAGATSIAIQNTENYIIAVPFISLIENKTSQHNNLLGVYGKIKDKAIKDYLNSGEYPKKIMVTYDSLCRLMELIEPFNFRLLIDEYHLLFTSYSFRYEACQCVLANYTKFKSYCFMTATLLEKDFVLKELQHLPVIEYEWENVREVTVNSMKCPQSVIPTVSYFITQFLNGEKEGNMHIFVNSVDFIIEIVRLLKLTDENTKAIWSTYNKSKVGLKNSLTTDKAKKINFYTSKCFEGVDLNDIDGHIYVVSDKSKSHSLTDISTSLQQLSGRIRNTKYWDTIHHIYTTTRYDVDMTYDQYKTSTLKGIHEANTIISQLNTLDDFVKNIVTLKEDSYVSKRDDDFIFDENLVKIDLYNFKVTKHLYRLRVNLVQEYQKYSFKVDSKDTDIKESYKISNYFKDVVLECKKGDSDYYLWACKKYPFLADAIKHLGYDKIEQLDYHLNNIKKSVVKFSSDTKETQIKKLLETEYKISKGHFISNKDLKAILDRIYKELKINKIAKSTDITQFYKVKIAQKFIINAVTKLKEKVNGIIIL